MRWDQHFKLPSDSFIEVKLALREYRGQNKGRNLKKVEVSRGTAWPQLHCVPLCVFNCYGEVVISIFSQHDVVYKRLDYTGNTKTGSGSSSIWSAVLLRYHLLAVSEEIFGNIKYSYCLKVCVCVWVSHPSCCLGSGQSWPRWSHGGTRWWALGWGWCYNCFPVSLGMSRRWSSGCCCHLAKTERSSHRSWFFVISHSFVFQY